MIPAGFYSQLWDWDAFFMANHFISRNQPEYMKYWAMTYLDGIDEEGYVSGGMTINGQRKLFRKICDEAFFSSGSLSIFPLQLTISLGSNRITSVWDGFLNIGKKPNWILYGDCITGRLPCRVGRIIIRP